MPSKIIATLDPHRLGDKLVLSGGNLIVTCTDVADIHRAVFGTIAQGAGISAFTCYFFSNSQPSAGLANLCSVGVAEVGSSLAKYVGEESTSFGLRPTEAAVYNNNASISGSADPPIQPTAERQCIGVLLDQTVSPALCVWTVNGSVVFQATLGSGKFYVPAVSIGSSTPEDVSAQLNFGQSLLDFPIFSVLK